MVQPAPLQSVIDWSMTLCLWTSALWPCVIDCGQWQCGHKLALRKCHWPRSMTEKSVIDWMYTIPKVLPDIERTIGIAGEVIIIFFLVPVLSDETWGLWAKFGFFRTEPLWDLVGSTGFAKSEVGIEKFPCIPFILKIQGQRTLNDINHTISAIYLQGSLCSCRLSASPEWDNKSPHPAAPSDYQVGLMFLDEYKNISTIIVSTSEIVLPDWLHLIPEPASLQPLLLQGGVHPMCGTPPWLDGVPDRLRRNHHALHGGMGPWSWDFLSQGPQEKRADRKSYLDGRKTRVDFNTKLFSLFSKPLDKTPHADNAMVVSESNYRSHKAGFNTTSQHAEHWSTETFS